VVGSLVHRALQRWLFPGDPGLDHLLETQAFNAGLVEEAARQAAVRAARSLLDRVRRHPAWEEMDQALERRSEVPYSRLVNGRVDTGYIDLLYRTDEGWVIVDFITDALRTESGLQEALAAHQGQITRYRHACQALLGSELQVRLCFLDYSGSLHLEQISA
jgi:ATP-dependent helicase/nuclease subunit A